MCALTCRVVHQAVALRTGLPIRQTAARLDRRPVDPLVLDAQVEHDLTVGEVGLVLRGERRVGVGAECWVDEGGVAQRVVEIDDGRKRFDVDVDHRAGVDGRVPVDGNDRHHGFTDESNGALGDQRPLAAGLEDRLHVRKGWQVEVLAGEDAEHTWHLLGVVDVVREDAAVRVLAAHEVHPRGVDRNIFDIGTANGQHARILDPLNSIAEDAPHANDLPRRRLVLVHRRAAPTSRRRGRRARPLRSPLAGVRRRCVVPGFRRRCW